MDNDSMRPGGRVQVIGDEKPLAHRFAKQIGMSIIASIIAAMFLNATGIKKAVQYAASIIVHTGGDPLTGKGGMVEEIKEKAGNYTKQHGTFPVPGGVPNLSPLRLTPEELAARAKLKDDERQRKEAKERDKWVARAAAVGLDHDDDWTLGDFKVKVPIAEQQAEYDAERKSLLASATELKMPVNDDWNNKDLKQAIHEEKEWQWLDGEYQERRRRYLEAIAKRDELLATGPNSRCPGRCGYQLRFSPSRTGKYVCPKCHGHFTVSQARACFVPPPAPKEPLPPRRKPSLLKRIFG